MQTITVSLTKKQADMFGALQRAAAEAQDRVNLFAAAMFAGRDDIIGPVNNITLVGDRLVGAMEEATEPQS